MNIRQIAKGGDIKGKRSAEPGNEAGIEASGSRFRRTYRIRCLAVMDVMARVGRRRRRHPQFRYLPDHIGDHGWRRGRGVSWNAETAPQQVRQDVGPPVTGQRHGCKIKPGRKKILESSTDQSEPLHAHRRLTGNREGWSTCQRYGEGRVIGFAGRDRQYRPGKPDFDWSRFIKLGGSKD